MEHPANVIMNQYFLDPDQCPRHRGNRPSSLPKLLHENLRKINLKLENNADHQQLRGLAKDRETWKAMVKEILTKKRVEILSNYRAQHSRRSQQARRRRRPEEPEDTRQDQTRRTRTSIHQPPRNPRKRTAEDTFQESEAQRRTRNDTNIIAQAVR